MTIPTVAIVGRPNVGKSALFNRLAGSRIAIVSEESGTTRDRVSTDAGWGDWRFILVDSGGIDAEDTETGRLPSDEQSLRVAIQSQTAEALRMADLVVFVADVTAGVTAADLDAADLVRRSGKPVVVAANKADNPDRERLAFDFYELGLGEPIAISAYHDIGIGDLMQTLMDLAPGEPESAGETDAVRIAIVGRPNVGKSELLNAITGESRAIVSPIPGTTRDAVDSRYQYGDQEIVFIDTAGLKRRGKARPGVERFSVLRTVQAIERSHVAVMVLDATEFVTAQDTHIAGFIEDASRGVVIVVNKWDRRRESGLTETEVGEIIRDRFKFIENAPILFTSALHRHGVDEVLGAALKVFHRWTQQLEPGELKRAVMSAVAAHPPPTGGRGEVRIYGVLQTQAGPPTFTFRSNRPDRLHFSYRRYLANQLRSAFDFAGCPLKLEFRKRR